ncbi:hypothetical protein C8R45DRAFT_930566 [Mycena sanguinolenta]|nr:hypothetical protein C8R45DRAFT_930566 [Mycena sanguinolenta]
MTTAISLHSGRGKVPLCRSPSSYNTAVKDVWHNSQPTNQHPAFQPLTPPCAQDSAVGIAADCAAINAAISTAGSRHRWAGFDPITWTSSRRSLPLSARHCSCVALPPIASSLGSFPGLSPHALISYMSQHEAVGLELPSAVQAYFGGPQPWLCHFLLSSWAAYSSRIASPASLPYFLPGNSGRRSKKQELEGLATNAVDGLSIFVWRNAAINAADHATDPINPNCRMLSPCESESWSVERR